MDWNSIFVTIGEPSSMLGDLLLPERVFSLAFPEYSRTKPPARGSKVQNRNLGCRSHSDHSVPLLSVYDFLGPCEFLRRQILQLIPCTGPGSAYPLLWFHSVCS